MALSEEVKRFVDRIKNAREDADLARLFSTRELESILNAEEAAAISTEIANRPISTDYIKRLRLTKRLRAKQINKRAYAYMLRDLIFVEYRKPYTRKPPGRPPKQQKTSFPIA